MRADERLTDDAANKIRNIPVAQGGKSSPFMKRASTATGEKRQSVGDRGRQAGGKSEKGAKEQKAGFNGNP
jgi:hypothetical protein